MDIYQNRNEYRTLIDESGLFRFRVTVKETDLMILVSREPLATLNPEDLTEKGGRAAVKRGAEEAVIKARAAIETEIRQNQDFLYSLHALDLMPTDTEAVRAMKWAGIKAHVGPMAAVAGYISEYVGTWLQQAARQAAGQTADFDTVIVENGGDLYVRSSQPVNVAIHAPGSPLSDKLALRVSCPEGKGVCTSCGTYGHSLSFGKSQAAVVIAPDTALADAAATRLGNLLKDSGKIQTALDKIMQVEGVLGAVAVVDDKIGFIGEVDLVPMT